MGYVLVPVPAEYVLNVMRWVLFRSSETDGEEQTLQDRASLLEAIESAEPAVLDMLRAIATATVDNQPLRLRDLGDDVGRTGDEVWASIDALNGAVLEEDRLLIEVRSEPSVSVFGKAGTMTYVSMRPDLAPLVRSAIPHPTPAE